MPGVFVNATDKKFPSFPELLFQKDEGPRHLWVRDIHVFLGAQCLSALTTECCARNHPETVA